VWWQLAHLYPAVQHPNRLTHYMKYFSELNISGHKFPLVVNDVPKFDILNPFLQVSVSTYESTQKDFIPLYVTPHRDRQTTDGDKRHYVLINSLSRLMSGRTAHHCQTFVWEYCLHPLLKTYNRHLPECSVHMPQ
jgi:hypothetical protein